MSATIIDGKAFAAKLTQSIGCAVTAVMTSGAPQPALRLCWSAKTRQVKFMSATKSEPPKQAAMQSIEHRLPDTTSQTELLNLIDQLNTDHAIDGILFSCRFPIRSMPMP